MPERASQVNAIIISVVGALIGVVIVYMGWAVAMNMKNTGK
jgi:VanZ family protein